MENIFASALAASNYADKLGAILAIKADAEKLEKELKKEILASGQREIDGQLFHVVVTESARESIDSKAVREVLTAEELAIVTKISTVTTVRCNSR